MRARLFVLWTLVSRLALWVFPVPNFTKYQLPENFNVFSDENGRTVICFTSEPSDTTSTREIGMSDVETFDAFITKVGLSLLITFRINNWEHSEAFQRR